MSGDVPEVLKRLMPAVVIKVNQYFGSFVRLNCICESGETFELKVYLADWLFRAQQAALANSSGSAAVNNGILSELNGRRLMEILVKENTELWLTFTDEFTLHITANLEEYEPEYELMIATLDTMFVTLSPTKGFVISPRSRTEH